MAWTLKRLMRRIWFRASLFSVAAVLTALVAAVVSPSIPPSISSKIGADAVDNILGIIAASMLGVTTFSLGAMVSAFSAATSNVTPRASRLVVEDPTTQNALAAFLGSFLFALVGIVAISAGVYGESGRVVLFAVTVGVIVLIVVTMVRWIDHLSTLGRVTETTAQVEEAAAAAMRERRDSPYLGAARWADVASGPPEGATPVFAGEIGYVQHVDVAALSEVAEEAKGRVYVAVLPGVFVDPGRPVAWFEGAGEDVAETIAAAFTIADTRSFDQDPRFGVCVLSEIGSRALSPGINDPGTAIDVIGRGVRVLAIWAESRPDEAEPEHPRVFAPSIEPDDLFDDLFNGIARDGAGIVEVGVRLQKAFRTLAGLGDGRFAEAARRHSRLAIERAEAKLVIEDDRRRLRDAAAGL